MTKGLSTLMLVLALALPISGCGKKGDAQPPAGYEAPDYKRAPELEPGPMDDESEKDDQDGQVGR